MRTRRSFLLAFVALALTVATTYAKSYDIDISAPSRAGKIQLKPGKYTLTVEGDQATFKSNAHRESLTTPVKLENGMVKFKDTMVNYAGDHISAIQLAGTKTYLVFLD